MTVKAAENEWMHLNQAIIKTQMLVISQIESLHKICDRLDELIIAFVCQSLNAGMTSSRN